MATDWSKYSSGPKKEEGGFLSALAKNAKGGADFLNPVSLVPSLVSGLGGDALSTAKELARLPTTAIGMGLAGGNANKLENNRLSFLTNTEYARNAQKDQPLSDLISSQINQAAPLLQHGAEAVAGTGIRGGAELASLATRIPGGPATQTAPELLQGTKMEGQTYGEAAGRGELFPMAVQDLLTVAPAAKGLGGRAANVAAAAERAPLAPYAIPARALTNAIDKAAAGGTAFPKLANTLGGVPGVGAAVRGAEAGTQWLGDVKRATGMRGEALATEAEMFTEAKPALDRMDAQIKAAEKGSVEQAELMSQKEAFKNDLMADVKREAKYNIVKDASKNVPEGVETVPTDAFGRAANVADDAAAVEARGMQGELSRIDETLGTDIGSRAAQGLDDAASKKAVRDIPEQFTDRHIDQAFKGLDTKAANNFALKTFDDITSTWKTGVLPLNPAWQMGNVVSNTVTAMTHGGVTPAYFWKNKARIMKEINEGTELSRGSLGSQAAEFARADAKTGAGKAARKVSDVSYAANEAVDNISHAAVALKQFDDLVASGVPKDLAVRQANARALEVMGNFGNMSAFEKNAIRRAVPFYTWAKHSAKMSLREPMLNPVKQARLAALSNEFDPRSKEQKESGFLESALPMSGGRYLNLPGSNMAQSGLGGIEESPLANPKALMGSLNPLAQGLLAAGGINARKGRTLETAPGQSRASAAAGYLTNLAPGSKAIADMMERINTGSNSVKGDVRNPLMVKGKVIKDTKQDVGIPGLTDIPAPLLKFLTGISVDQPDLKAAAKRETKAEKADTKSAKKYDKNLTKAQTKK